MSAVPGAGSQLKVGLNSGAPTMVIGSVKDISGPTWSNPMIAAHRIQGSGQEFWGGLPDGGDVTATLILDSTNINQATLIAAVTNETTYVNGNTVGHSFAIVFGTTTESVQFTGLFKGFSFDGITSDGTVQATLGIKVSGAVTLP